MGAKLRQFQGRKDGEGGEGNVVWRGGEETRRRKKGNRNKTEAKKTTQSILENTIQFLLWA